MKHAFLITVYKDIDQVGTLIYVLCRNFDCDCYVHIDKKSDIDPDELRDLLSLYKNRTKVYKKYNVNWGSYNHLRCQLFLLHKSFFRNTKYDYFHLITGQDLPLIKSQTTFDAILGGKSYLYYGKFPNDGWYRGGMSRVDKFHPLNLFNLKKNWQLFIYDKFIKLQYLIGYKKNTNFNEWYFNSPYWSLYKSDVEAILRLFDNNKEKFSKLFKYCYIPEEMFYSTLLGQYSNGFSDIVCDSMRFEDWDEDENPGNVPAVLGIQHYDEIRNSGKLFARKFDRTDVNSYTIYSKIVNWLLI